MFPNEVFTISVYSEKKEVNFEQLIGKVDIKPLLISYIK